MLKVLAPIKVVVFVVKIRSLEEGAGYVVPRDFAEEAGHLTRLL
jgi:hypothetical protein